MVVVAILSIVGTNRNKATKFSLILHSLQKFTSLKDNAGNPLCADPLCKSLVTGFLLHYSHVYKLRSSSGFLCIRYGADTFGAASF